MKAYVIMRQSLVLYQFSYWFSNVCFSSSYRVV